MMFAKTIKISTGEQIPPFNQFIFENI